MAQHAKGSRVAAIIAVNSIFIRCTNAVRIHRLTKCCKAKELVVAGIIVKPRKAAVWIANILSSLARQWARVLSRISLRTFGRVWILNVASVGMTSNDISRRLCWLTILGVRFSANERCSGFQNESSPPWARWEARCLPRMASYFSRFTIHVRSWLEESRLPRPSGACWVVTPLLFASACIGLVTHWLGEKPWEAIEKNGDEGNQQWRYGGLKFHFRWGRCRRSSLRRRGLRLEKGSSD